MASTISVPFTIRADSGIREAVSPGYPNPQPTATVVFKVRQENRNQLVGDLIGTSVKVSSGTSPAVLRTFPFRYPPSPNLICRSVDSIEFVGGGVMLSVGYPWMARRICFVTATFGPPTFDETGQFDASGQPYTTTSFGIGVDKLTVPNSSFMFSRLVPTNTNVGVNIPVMQISMKRLMMPYPPIAEIANLAGCVNDSPMVWPYCTFDTGTVLMVGGNVEISFDAVGNVMWTADYQLSWRGIPWSFFLHPDGRTGWAPVFDRNGNPPYPTADLTQLP